MLLYWYNSQNFIPSRFNTFNPLSANFTKWSNILKQFVGKLPTNCLSVFDHFVGLALKGLRYSEVIISQALFPNRKWYVSVWPHLQLHVYVNFRYIYEFQPNSNKFSEINSRFKIKNRKPDFRNTWRPIAHIFLLQILIKIHLSNKKSNIYFVIFSKRRCETNFQPVDQFLSRHLEAYSWIPARESFVGASYETANWSWAFRRIMIHIDTHDHHVFLNTYCI